MPVKLNCGLSQKVGEANYGSRGASINIEMELDSGIVAEPAKLQERIRQLFGQLRASLAAELGGGNGHGSPESRNNIQPATAPAQARNAGPGANGQANARLLATASQVKAIQAIARNRKFDLEAYLQANHRVRRPEDLDIKTASQIIDALKAGGTEGRAA